jgi:hypothetical protein
MRDGTRKGAFPRWAPKAALAFGAATLLFLMGLTIAATLNVQVPQGARFLLISGVALGVAMSTAFLGGEAAANGQIPIPGTSEHPVRFSMSGGLAAFAIVVLIGTWAYPKPASHRAMARTVPFDTFWVYAGLYDRTHFVEPYTSVAYRPSSAERGDLLPKIGDVLRLYKERRVMIANYKTRGEAEIMTSPALVSGNIYDHAVTGKTVPEGTLLLVRDVVQSYDPTQGNSITAVWCRVAECEDGMPTCAQAEFEGHSHGDQ